MIFDFHARLNRQLNATGALIATMDDTGIDRAAVSAGGLLDLDRLSEQIATGGRCDARADNDRLRRRCARSNGRLVPFFFADPARDVAEYRAVAGDYRGLEVSPAVHGCRFSDPGVAALVTTAAAAGHPVYTVCLDQDGSRTADLVSLARRFPRVTFVFGHCGYTGLDAAGLARVAPCPNIVAETSGCFTAIARLALDRLGPRRVLFGTEYPLQHPRVEIAKLDALGLSPSDRDLVCHANACRLIGEECP